MSAKLHHGAVAFDSIDDEDDLLFHAGEILASEGGRLKGLCLADSGDFELSFEVPEDRAIAPTLFRCRPGWRPGRPPAKSPMARSVMKTRACKRKRRGLASRIWPIWSGRMRPALSVLGKWAFGGNRRPGLPEGAYANHSSRRGCARTNSTDPPDAPSLCVRC